MITQKTPGTWRGQPATQIKGEVFVHIGTHGSWFKPASGSDEFKRMTLAEANDPKLRDLQKIGQGYKGFSHGR